jgi:hypothetical protein
MNVQDIYHRLSSVAQRAATAGDQQLATDLRTALELFLYQEREIAALRKTISGMKMEGQGE